MAVVNTHTKMGSKICYVQTVQAQIHTFIETGGRMITFGNLVTFHNNCIEIMNNSISLVLLQKTSASCDSAREDISICDKVKQAKENKQTKCFNLCLKKKVHRKEIIIYIYFNMKFTDGFRGCFCFQPWFFNNGCGKC